MTIAFPCESCGHGFQVDASHAGKKCKCKKCGHIFSIPVPRQPAPATVKTSGAEPPPKPRSSSPTRPSSRPARAPDPYADLGSADPYGLEEPPPPPLPPRAAAAATPRPDEDEEFQPYRAPKTTPKKSKKSRKSSGETWYERLPIQIMKYGGLTIAGLIPLAFFLPSVFGVLLTVAVVAVAGSLYVIGAIGMMAVPFSEDIVCGLLNLFLPFYSLYYLITRWGEMKRWFLSSFVAMSIIMVCGIFLPAIAAGRDAANRARLRQQGQVAGEAGDKAGPSADAGAAEKELVAQIDLIESLGDLLASVHDEDTASRVGPEFREMRDRLIKNDPRIQQLNRDAGFLERLSIDAKYTARAEKASARFKSEQDRCMASPKIWVALSNGPSAPSPFPGAGPNRGRELARATLPPPTLPGAAPSDEPPAEAESAPEAAPSPVPTRTPARKPRQPGRPKNDETTKSLDDLLADLQAPEQRPRKRALELLMRTPVETDRREEIALAIVPILKDPDHFTRNDAAKTLAFWGGKECTPAIIEALGNDDHFFKVSLLEAAAAIKDPDAAEAVAACLPSQKKEAARALIAMGPEAEPAVVKLLTHRDVFTRTEACKVLKEIGTKKSIAALQALYKRVNGFGFDADAAKDAAAAINQKKGLPGKSSVKKTTTR